MKLRQKWEEDDSKVAISCVSAHCFCPRLAWLKRIEGLEQEDEQTILGEFVHRNVRKGGAITDPEGEVWHSRSLWLASPELGVSGRLDLVEPDGESHVFPVDMKEGASNDGRLWETDRVQLTLQAMLLENAGFRVDKVAAWYHDERRRISEPLTDDMRTDAMHQVAQTRQTLAARGAPPPLVDGAKCFDCPMNDVCLPDELRRLQLRAEAEEPDEDVSDPEGESVGESAMNGAQCRRVVAPRFDTLPLYVDSAAVVVRLKGSEVRVEDKNRALLCSMGIATISHVNVFGNANITTPLLRELLDRGVPVCFFSSTGWYRGRTLPTMNRLVHVREQQYEAARDDRAMHIARRLVENKIYNGRILLRRNLPLGDDSNALSSLRYAARSISGCDAFESLLGIEGNAARIYWSAFSSLVARTDEAFAMRGRSRRPPLDRTNAILSYLYGMLAKDMALALEVAGFDPFQGFYHTNHHGRPSLALDMMEPFRPLIADSVALTVIRKREVEASDFQLTGQEVSMKPQARKAVIRAYERRMDEMIVHPDFGYSVSYRRILYIQARLLSRYLAGEISEPPRFRTR